MDFRQAELDAPDLAMLEYADRLTRQPWTVTEDDVIALRETGFDDRDILHINMIAGYYAFVNRLADGLGVELEAFWRGDQGRQG
ncbi:MAG: peroxidase [candidate division Zixibacteria bacterium]|nr:peroxidase [candidate division Zixibacteria bacterium]